MKKPPEEGPVIKEKAETPQIPAIHSKTNDQGTPIETKAAPIEKETPSTYPKANDQGPRVESSAPPAEKEASSTPPVTSPEKMEPVDYQGMTSLDLLDYALEYCRAANDFWERGDPESALDALDKAYSFILRAKLDDDPDLLQQKEDLRLTISKRIIEIHSSRYTVAEGLHRAIPLVMNDHVKKAIDSFRGPEREFFLAAYRRSGRYRPAILRALKESGFPRELSWLPLIESGYKVRAHSPARALGMWQFIASTGYRFGLNRDQWVDERMDVGKSTRAALAYLKELHQIFGDWTTALAAYNCGEWGVLNRIKTQKINYLDQFWDLYEKLPAETASYVPRFMAVLHIVNNPASYGFELPPVEKELQVEEVIVTKQIQLKTIAQRLDINEDFLEELNAELKQDMTPDKPYTLKVPAGKGPLLIAKLDEIPAWCPPSSAPAPSKYVLHKVRKGETLGGLSKRYHTAESTLRSLNNLKKGEIKVGLNIKVPAAKIQVPTSPASPPSLPVKTADLGVQKYVVKKGDSLWQVAGRYNTTASEIKALNRLKNTHLHSGQVLMIPQSEEFCSTEQTKNYTVKGGDTPFTIAKKHQMDLTEFFRLNKITPQSTIFPGQTLLIRGN